MQIKLEEFKKHLKLAGGMYQLNKALPQTGVFTIIKNSSNIIIKYFDSIIFSETKIPNNEPVDGEITINVDGSLLLSLLSKLNCDDIDVEITSAGLNIKTGTNKYSFESYTIDNLANCPYNTTAYTKSLKLPKDVVNNIVKYNSNALCINPEEKELINYCLNNNECITTNYELITFYQYNFGIQALLNPKVMRVLASICEKDCDVNIFESTDDKVPSFIQYVHDNSVIYAPYVKIEKYPITDIDNVKNQQFTDTIKINKEELLSAMDRLNLFKGETNVLIFNFENSKLTIQNSNNTTNHEEIAYEAGSASANSHKYFININNLTKECLSLNDKILEISIGNDNFILIKCPNVTKIVALSYED